VNSEDIPLITGGSGFIGGRLVRSFSENRVRLLDVEAPPTTFDNVDVIQGDIRNQETVKRAVAGSDVVFHQAGLVDVTESVVDPKASHSINAAGTLNVLEAARKHDVRVVIASSAAVYGDPDTRPIVESATPDPTSPYGLDKLAADQYARLYHDLYGLETVALRYFNVYGPGQDGGDYAGVIETFLEQASNDDPITVHGDGEQTRDFVHVEDVVEANRLAAETDAVGNAYNIGTGESVRIYRLAERIRSLVDSSSEIVHTEPREGGIRHSCADVTRARERLGYEPEISIEEGLRTLV
jgi:UDP-glucose 4-epimerase